MIADLKTFNHGVAWEDSYGYSQGVRAGDLDKVLAGLGVTRNRWLGPRS